MRPRSEWGWGGEGGEKAKKGVKTWMKYSSGAPSDWKFSFAVEMNRAFFHDSFFLKYSLRCGFAARRRPSQKVGQRENVVNI